MKSFNNRPVLRKRVLAAVAWSTCLTATIALCGEHETPRKEHAENGAATTAPQPQAWATAHIDLYNPTRWSGPTVVEVPTGQIAAPGTIDWSQVRLVRDADQDVEEVPFFIREGRPHWKSKLIANIKQPRAEDLLVFFLSVAPKTWTRLHIVPGQPSRSSALTRTSSELQC